MESTSLLRNIALVMGATVLSVIGPDMLRFFPEGSARNICLSLLGLALLLYGFGSIEICLREVRIKVRNSRCVHAQIGILCGVSRKHSQDIPLVWSDITAEEWESEIQTAANAAGKKIRTKLIYANDSFDRNNAIINPFGGNYPESSFHGFPVYNKLLEYVGLGGLFVNVADIPTYWAYNPRLKRKLERTPAVYGVTGEEVRYFQRAPLVEELALRIINVEPFGPPNWSIQIAPQYGIFGNGTNTILASRAAIVEGNMDSIISPIKFKDQHVTPLFFSNYGEGRFLISLSFLDGEFTSNRALKAVIAKLIINQIEK